MITIGNCEAEVRVSDIRRAATYLSRMRAESLTCMIIGHGDIVQDDLFLVTSSHSSQIMVNARSILKAFIAFPKVETVIMSCYAGKACKDVKVLSPTSVITSFTSSSETLYGSDVVAMLDSIDLSTIPESGDILHAFLTTSQNRYTPQIAKGNSIIELSSDVVQQYLDSHEAPHKNLKLDHLAKRALSAAASRSVELLDNADFASLQVLTYMALAK